MIVETQSCDIPACVNEELVLKALSHQIDSKNVRINKLTISMGCDSGDNYLSKLYRVLVAFRKGDSKAEQISLIIKCVLQAEDGKSNFFEEIDIYKKERFMYLEVLPQLEGYLDGVKLMPRCFYATSEPSPILVCEDMKASEFQIADRLLGLDENHCRIVLRKLGQYHAASLILLDNKPLLRKVDELQQGIFSTSALKRDGIVKTVQQNLYVLVDNLPNTEEFADIIRKLKSLDVKIFLKNVSAVIQPMQEEDLSVVNHGDVWINNFLFKYDLNGSNPVDLVFIDFQACTIGGLGLDLNYFLATSPAPGVLSESIEELISDVYYSAFKDVLEKFNYNGIPDFNQVQKEINRAKIYRLFCSLFILPVISLQKEASPDVTIEKIRKGQVNPNIFATKRFLNTMKIILFEFDRNGLLDYCSEDKASNI